MNNISKKNWIILMLIIRNSIAVANKLDGFTETNSFQLTPHSRYAVDTSHLDTNDVRTVVTDPLEEDDHDDFELYDIIVQSENIEDLDVDKYNDEHRQRFVDLHNLYRRNFTYPIPEGSNMKMIEYNNTLEWAANEYAKLCKYEHGFAENDNMTWGSGQNLYRGASSLFTRYIWLFYREFVDWDFENQTCRMAEPDEEEEVQCGHFTQVMWGYTQHIGCARRSYCFPRTSVLLINCHYHPAGNWRKGNLIDTYRYGTPCTSSEMADGNLCHKNLTVDRRMCQDYNLDCECVLDCKNCAKPNFKTCRCDCKEGWDYNDCGIPCEDTFHLLYPKFLNICPEFINYPNYYPNLGCNYTFFLLMKCRQSCGFCPAVNKSSSPDRHCCGGKTCEQYSVLNTTTCECVKDCPTFGCLYQKAESIPLRVNWTPFNASSVVHPMQSVLSAMLLISLLLKILAKI